MLKPMPHCFDFDELAISIMPVWVTLLGLPLACWNPNALGKIAFLIGRLISSDKLMVTKDRISFTRVLVKVDASKKLARSVMIKLPTRKIKE